MNGRKAIIAVCCLILGVGGAALWFHFHPAAHETSPPRPPRPVAELEELVFRTPFDPNLEWELGRASYQKFKDSMKTDEDAGSECMSSYMIAAIESDSGKDIKKEFQERFDDLAEVAGVPPGQSIDDIIDTFRPIYTDGIKPNIQHILSVRDAVEPVFTRIDADDRGLEHVMAAQQATERYLRAVFDVEIGKVHVLTPDGHSMMFTPSFFQKWEDGMRSYGLVVAVHSRLSVQGFVGLDSLNNLPNAGMPQVDSGDSYGRFSLPDDREVIPGLRYFEAAAEREEREGHALPQGELADGPTADSPVGAYRRFLDLCERGLWSEAFDLFEANSQHKMIEETRSYLQSHMTDSSQQQRMNAMSDREIWILVGRTGEMHPTAIIGRETRGDNAVVRTRIQAGGKSADRDVSMVRSNGAWKMVWR